MKITLHPIAGLPGAADDAVSVAGDVLTVNGTAYDLSTVPEGGEAMPEGDHPFIGPITRKDGELHLGLRLVYDRGTALPDQPVDPDHWRVTLTSGALPDPIARKTEAET